MTTRELGRRWGSARARLRERVARVTPRTVVQYPFEVVVALVTLCMGVPLLIGLFSSAALIALVGHVAYYAWASALTLGGLTVAVGLRAGKEPPIPQVLAAGLSLAGGSFAIYCIAVGAVLGLAGTPAMGAYLGLGLICAARASHFRRVIDIQEGATRLQEGAR